MVEMTGKDGWWTDEGEKRDDQGKSTNNNK